MAATLATRKPIDQITVADLVDFPIWEFCLDEEGVEGMDETWVRPLAAAAVPNGAYSLSVAAEFETASGLRVNGLIGVTTAEGEVEIAYPVLLFDGKYLFVPSQHDMQIGPDDEKLRRAVVDALGPSPVFPLRYRLSVPIEGEASHREGTVA
jgi:hypothetical protein